MSQQRLLFWATVGFSLTLAGIILAFNMGLALAINDYLYDIFPLYHRLAHYLLRVFPLSDKLAHFLLAGGLSLLLNLTLRASRLRVGPVNILVGTLILLPLAALEEFSQLAIAYRTFSLQDLTANYVGIIVFGWIASAVLKISRARQRCGVRRGCEVRTIA